MINQLCSFRRTLLARFKTSTRSQSDAIGARLMAIGVLNRWQHLLKTEDGGLCLLARGGASGAVCESALLVLPDAHAWVMPACDLPHAMLHACALLSAL
eukprot:1730777-Pleurochrysis_carterae.AAC.1